MLPIYHQKNTDRVAETVFKRNCLGVNSTLAFPGANFGLLSPVASLSAPLSASLPPSCCLSRKLSGLMPHPLCSLTPYPVSLVSSCPSRSRWLSLCAFLGATEGGGDVQAVPETRRRGCFLLPASQPGLYWRCKCSPLCHSRELPLQVHPIALMLDWHT